MKWQDYIGSNPAICHGQLCFKVKKKLTRIMVYLIIEMLEAGETPADILNAYPQLTQNHIQAALHYAAEVIKIGELISFAEV